ncbi:hypothetical protein BGZ80_003616 [Entomortierella chlamydospora]|uniref:Uncharacterized protein n=1 Tax=Entomortierella chlamydospora TaxID=101097 RepID=A0A9P6T2Y9_9FUNG|nr:hypothetical protein BGZ80_003616 [Entomortierella chlamydospora]
MVLNIFSTSSETRGLHLKDVLKLAGDQLENARNASASTKALKFCDKAKMILKDAEIIVSNDHAGDQTSDDDIANAYYKHGKLLEELGQHAKAQKSLNKAEKWGHVHVVTQQASSSRPIHTTGSIGPSLCPPPALWSTPRISMVGFQGVLDSSNTSESTPPELIQGKPLSEIKNQTPLARKDDVVVSRLIFHQEITLPITKFDLPEVGGRISNTTQLAYCINLLHHSLSPRDGLDKAELDWSNDRSNDPDEQERLKSMVTDVIRAFIRDELKEPGAVVETVSLATVLKQNDTRKLLQVFTDGIKQSLLLDVHLLDGLAHLIRNTPAEYLDSDDLIKILNLLGMKLKNTHQQSSQHIYQLASTVSCVLDSMVDSQVKGISREQLHEPLSEYLKNLQKSSDACLVYQAAYAYQSLQYIPDDETILQAMVRRTGKVLQGISGVVNAVKALDLNEFIKGLDCIHEGLAGAGKAIVMINEGYQSVKTLTENGQGLLESLKEGFSFSRKSAWYPALRGLDTLLQEGRLAEFERLIREAPCRKEAAFQWGVCQRLGELALNTLWDIDTRQHAISFLREMYTDDPQWGQEPSVKQWILHILRKLAESSESAIAGPTQRLLQDLETSGDSKKRTGSTEGQSGDIYISPRAKVHTSATEDFDLTFHVEEFLKGNKKVFLLLGDSGAGKSTFNRAFEITLWDKYDKNDRRIPLFIHLPTIKQPEEDLIDKHLRKSNFTEDQIRELKLHHEFILICDGYDESQQTRNLYMSNQLNQPSQWRAQMVISCRTEYTGVDYKDCFRPTDRNNRGNLDLFQEAIISPFNKVQIQDYVDQYVRLRNPSWESKDYLLALKQIPNLQDLVTNPFLLKISLEALPKLVNTKDDYSQTRVTRVELYDGFVQQWIERGKIRLGEMELSSRDKEAFKTLLMSGFSMQGITYLKELATAVYENQRGNPVVSYSEPHDHSTWKQRFFDNNNGNNLLREAVPLTRNSDQYRFIHKSVLEYGLSLAIFDPSIRHENTEPLSTLSRRGSTGSMDSFEELPLIENRASVIDSPLLESPFGRMRFVDQASVLQFLVERVQQHRVFEEQLLAIIERSKVEKSTRIAAANAITVLVRAGIEFIGTDLRGIQIPGADLSNGMFDSAQLDGADLRKVNLRGVWMRNASLRGSQMKDVHFDELPLLQEKHRVYSCTYSHDGKLLAVGLEDGDINLYDTSTWEKIQTLQGHSGIVECLALSKKNGRIVSCGWDKTVRLWDVETGICVDTLLGHSSHVMGVSFSPNGDRIVSGSRDRTVRLWDVETGSCAFTLTGHGGGVIGVAYSPDGDQIASGSSDATVRLWDVGTGSCARILRGHSNCIFSLTYSPNGDQIVSGSFDMTVRLWDTVTGACIHILQGHGETVMSVVYSPNGDQIASGSLDSTVRLWNVETGSCTQTLQGHSQPICSIAYSPSGGQIASGSTDCTVRLWDVAPYNSVHAQQNNDLYITSVAFSPDGDRIVSGGFDQTVQLWDVETGIRTRAPQGHSHFVNSVAYSPDGNLIASGSRDKTLRIWNVETGNCINTLHGHSDNVSSVAFSPDGHWVASGGGDKIVRLWSVETCSSVNSFEGHSDEVNSVAYSPNGNQVASGSDDETVRLWDIETSNCIHTLEGHDGSVICVAYSPNGSHIASGSVDGTIRLWDVEKGDCDHTLSGHSKYITSVTYSPKGDTIASGSSDNTVRLWDSESGQFLIAISGFSGPVTSVAWRDMLKGQYLATGSLDRSVRCWQIIKEQDEYKVHLHWTSSRGALTLADASFIDVQGLSQIDLKLLSQLKASNIPPSPIV